MYRRLLQLDNMLSVKYFEISRILLVCPKHLKDAIQLHCMREEFLHSLAHPKETAHWSWKYQCFSQDLCQLKIPSMPKFCTLAISIFRIRLLHSPVRLFSKLLANEQGINLSTQDLAFVEIFCMLLRHHQLHPTRLWK